MAAEIGTIIVECKSRDNLIILKDFYNEFMGAHNDDYENVYDEEIQETCFEGMPKEYSFEDDIYGLFDDPMETPLLEFVQEFIKKNDKIAFNLNYDLSWDNCGETWNEEYIYENHVLKIKTIFDPHDEDDIEDEDSFKIGENAQVTNRTIEFNGIDFVEIE